MRRKAPELRLEQLTGEHDVAAFDAGTRHPAINAFLHDQALLEQEEGLARVWLALDTNELIAGYFTLHPVSVPLAASVIAALGLPSTVSKEVAGYLVGRVGVHHAWVGQRLGDALDALAIDAAQQDASAAFIAVDARNDALAAWYEGLKFSRLVDGGQRMVHSLA